jgi:hypothetical protein
MGAFWLGRSLAMPCSRLAEQALTNKGDSHQFTEDRFDL